jgi:plasmid replication initiation protein
MNKRNLTAWIANPALLIAGFLGATASVRAGGVPDSEAASKLLSEAKTMAFQLKEDAVTMESFTRMNVSWETHALAINQIKEHVNALGKQHVKLLDAKDAAAPWQRVAIDRILPYLDELEGYTSAVIEHFNEQPKQFLTAEYKDFLEANADYASDLAAMIANFVDYGKTKQRMENLTDKLELRNK